MQIVKVRYLSEIGGILSAAVGAREYSYYAEESLALGDIVVVPVQDTIGKAQVTAINVPEAEIESFKDKVKTILAGAGGKGVLAPGVIQDIENEPENTGQELTTYTAAIRIRPETDFQFIEYQKQARSILAYAEIAVITDDAEMRASANDLGVISLLKKSIEEKRQEYVRPINEHIKSVNAAFKTLTDPIEKADKITREKITLYRAGIDRKRHEAEAINLAKEDLARREAALNHGEFTVDTTPVIVPEAPAAHVRTEAATLGTSKVWKFEVTNFTLIPDEYKLADLVKIGKVIRAGVNIPGVKSWQEDSIRISATR